ncbi:MAG: ATP-binding cassette domain-containing protein, partial [Candidatus Geothermarchaeales archaeon]
RKDRIGGYSKGMQQRFGIAQALLGDPRLLVLDEPSLGLDPGGMVEVRETIRTIAQDDVTIFMSSHLLHEVQQVCGYVTIINKGRSLETGTLEEIASRLEEPPLIRVEVEDLTDKVMKAVRALPFVKDATLTDSQLDVTVDTEEDVRGEISRTVAKAGGTVLSTEVVGRSLEDTYMKLLRRSGAR